MQRIHITLSKQQLIFLKHIAKESNLSLSEHIRYAIYNYQKEIQKLNVSSSVSIKGDKNEEKE